MFERMSRGWRITKQSFQLIGRDPEMLAFPLLAVVVGFFGVVAVTGLAGALVYTLDPGMFGDMTDHADENPAVQAAGLGYMFAVTFVVTTSSIYANFAVLNTLRVRLDGGDATFMDSVRAANGRLGDIMKWSLVVTTVGLVLHAIESACERLGGIGSLIARGVAALMGGAWNVVSFMVVPAMVMDGVGPKQGLERSVEALKKSWGEGLTAHVSMGFVSFMACIPFFVMLVLGGGALANAAETGGSMWYGGGLLGLSFVYITVAVLMLSVARVLFSGTLYRFATTGKIGDEYDDDLVSGAFTPKD